MRTHWYDVGRIGAISDGVFAIAMTLLVLDLTLPELEAPVSREAFQQALVGQVPHLFSWLISFAILCRLWLTQHSILERGDKQSRGFTTVNFAFLGVISFIPFPTSLISEHAEQPLSVIVFSATYAAASLTLAGMWLLSERKEQETEAQKTVNRSVLRVLVGMPILALLACLLALFDPRYGIAVWIALPFLGMTITRKKRHEERLT